MWQRRLGKVVGYHLLVESWEVAKLAFPMVLVQLGQIAIMTINTAFIGRIGVEALGAVALASKVYLFMFTLGIGPLVAVPTLTAQAFGANDPAKVRRSLRMGLWMAMLLSIPIAAVALRAEALLVALGQAPDVARLGQQYLSGLVWGVAPALSLLVIRGFMGGVNRPEPVFWITLSAIPVNALLNYLLIYGKFGLPRLELFGSGLATALVNSATFSAGLWVATTRRPFRNYHVLAQFWRVDWPSMRQLLAVGAPISIAFLMKDGLFSAGALLAGLIGTSALAAHQVTLQVAAIPSMISFGISTAAAVRVGNAVGRRDGYSVWRAGVAAILIGVAIAAVWTVLVIVARFEIAELLLGGLPESETTIGLTATLLLVGASLFVTDAAQSIAAGGLRGLRDTRVPILLAGTAYWVFGFSLSYILSSEMGLGAIGIWMGISIGTAIYAGLLVSRFLSLANKRAQSSA
ncbi:MATE family efflux transporter [Bradyrhizobium sp. 180]|nr:MATE family efflux transporter [Bradyrhizobium sp. 180]